MGQSMVGRLAIKARQVRPGDAFAAAVPAGGLVEIVDLDGRQVAELVAFDQADPSERISLGVTRRESQSIMLSLGMKVYSSRGRAMLDLVEDTVGRHDLLWTTPTGVGPGLPGASGPASDVGTDSATGLDGEAAGAASGDASREAGGTSMPGNEDSGDPLDAGATSNAVTEGPGPEDGTEVPAAGGVVVTVGEADDPPADPRPNQLTGFAAALESVGLATPDVPDPINFFMQLAVMQRGDLELREPLSERGDRVVLQALTDLIVAVRCSAAPDETNGGSPSDILVRVYR